MGRCRKSVWRYAWAGRWSRSARGGSSRTSAWAAHEYTAPGILGRQLSSRFGWPRTVQSDRPRNSGNAPSKTALVDEALLGDRVELGWVIRHVQTAIPADLPGPGDHLHSGNTGGGPIPQDRDGHLGRVDGSRESERTLPDEPSRRPLAAL